MTCRQLDNDSISEEAGENLSNLPNPVLWEDIHVLGDKPRTDLKSRDIKTKQGIAH